jgi:Tetratricopeptide repeat
MSLLGEDIGTPLALVDRALALNPGYATAWFWSGFIKLFAGSTDVAIEHFQTSLRLDPRTTLRPFTDTGIGCCYFLQRRFDEAVTLLAGSLRQVPTYVPTAWALASCYAHMDRLDDARAILEHLRANGSPVIPPPNILFRDPDQRASSSPGCGAPFASRYSPHRDASTCQSSSTRCRLRKIWTRGLRQVVAHQLAWPGPEPKTSAHGQAGAVQIVRSLGERACRRKPLPCHHA